MTLMRHCLIFPFGGQTKWIDLSIRDLPDLEWVIIAANDASEDAPKTEDRQFYQKALKYARDRRVQEQEYPAPKQRQYKVLNVPEFPQFYEVLAYFRHLFLYLQDQGFDQFSVHLSSGLTLWRFALYQCAEEFRNVFVNPFVYNKDTGTMERIQIYRALTDIEQNLIALLAGVAKISLSDLTTMHSQQYGQKTLSYILKVVNHLEESGLVDGVKAGRVKMVSLSPMGWELYQPKTREKNTQLFQHDFGV